MRPGLREEWRILAKGIHVGLAGPAGGGKGRKQSP